MSLEQILERLTDRFGLLTRGSRQGPTRQQAISYCVDWSYDLCTAAERRLWARLSVFAGSFDLEAAEDVGDGDVAPDNVVDLLTSLVDKSILVRVETNGQVRFRLLETLRDYGLSKLNEAGEYLRLRRRHLDWCRRHGERRDGGLVQLSTARLDQAHPAGTPNWREALEFALTDSPQTALAMSPGCFTIPWRAELSARCATRWTAS